MATPMAAHGGPRFGATGGVMTTSRGARVLATSCGLVTQSEDDPYDASGTMTGRSLDDRIATSGITHSLSTSMSTTVTLSFTLTFLPDIVTQSLVVICVTLSLPARLGNMASHWHAWPPCRESQRQRHTRRKPATQSYEATAREAPRQSGRRPTPVTERRHARPSHHSHGGVRRAPPDRSRVHGGVSHRDPSHTGSDARRPREVEQRDVERSDSHADRTRQQLRHSIRALTSRPTPSSAPAHRTR